MNSKENKFASRAAEADRKRAAAKKLIERYYYQLTKGCGNPQCNNDNCASNCHITKLKPNQAAAAALQLFKAKAKLCVFSQAGVETSSSSNPFDPLSATSCMGEIATEAAGSLSLSELSSPSEEICSMDISNSTSSNNLSSGKTDNFLSLSHTANSKTISLDNSASTHSFRNSGTSNPDVTNTLPDSKFQNSQPVDKVLSETTVPMRLAEIPSPSEENCSMDISNVASTNDLNQGQGECYSFLPPAMPRKSNTITFNVEPSSSTASFGVSFLDEESLLNIIEECKTKQSFSLLIRTLGQVFSSEDSLQMSFTKNLASKGLCKEDIRAMEVDEDKDKDSKEDAGNSAMCTAAKNGDITVDVESVRRSFRALFSIPEHPFQRALINALIILSENLEFDFKYGSKTVMDGSILNIFVVVMEIPMLECPEYMESAFPAFCKAASLLPVQGQAKLARMWSTFGPARLKEMVDTLHQFITLKVITGNYTRDYCINDEETIVAATKVMKILFYANMFGGDMDDELLIMEETEQNEVDDNFQDLLQGATGLDSKEPKPAKEDLLGQELRVKSINCRDPVMSFEEFYNEPLSEQLEMDRDFAYYKTEGGKFSFMNYSFILTPAVKALGLYYDNRIRMYSERRISVLHSLVHGAPPNPYLRLRVRRDHIIDDALVGLEMVAMENPNNLKKQLVVEFEGEQGIDEGGVSKEFFQLVVDEVFNPDFAMFTLNPETQTYWFNPTSFESDAQFTLIGIILGLAIYNNIILDVHLPMVVYRKLMGKKGTFHDLQDWNPILSKGLQDMLSHEGEDIETIFMQTFRITYQDVFGTVLVHDLKENGDQILVNQVSKEEFVELYAGFLLNKSIEKQFNAFRRGFQMVTDDSPLKMLFRPEEVELLVCGSKNFDFNALEEATEYDGGYMSDTVIIRWFWELVHDFSLDQKRKLLQFTTGSDRVPVGGLSKLKLVIARHGPDSDRLPTAHTCFNVLLLPEYSSKEKLEERLLKAINYSKGFGML